MIASLLGVLSLSALPAADAFPRWQRQARQVDVQAQASLLACPAPVTSFVPIITTIPECSEGNACHTNTIISQGQTYITSTLASSFATGLPGDIVGGTTVVNNGASATNVAFPAATVCTADCVLGGSTYTPGTVYYSTSAVAPPSATTVVGGSTLTDTTAPISSATPVTMTYYSTTVNGVPVTDGAQPLTTLTAGINGISTTVIQPASQVVASLQNAATPGLNSGAPTSNVITIITPGSAGPVTQVVSTGPDGVPTTITPAPGTGSSVTNPGDNSATTPIAGGNDNGNPANESPAPVDTAAPSTNVVAPPAGVTGLPGNNAGPTNPLPASSAVDVPASSVAGVQDVTSSIVPAAASTTSSTLPATTSSTGLACTNDSDCDSIVAAICVKALGALSTDVGVCVAGTPNSASSTISSLTNSASATTAGISSTGSSASSSILPTGVPGSLPVGTCTQNSDCFLGVCVQAGLTPLVGTGLGVCLGSSTNAGASSSSSAGAPAATQSASPANGNSGLCTSDMDCLIGLCLDATLSPVLGVGTGLCLGNNVGMGANPTTGGSGATSSASGAPASSASPIVASCDATTTCAVGVCLSADLLPVVGTAAGICLGQNTATATDPTTGTTSSTVNCGTTQDCLVGLCLDLGILGGNVCVGSSQPLVSASVTASVSAPSATLALPTVSTGLPAIPTGAVTCTPTQGCLVGVCAQIGLFNLGANVGICVGSTSSSTGLLGATVSAGVPAGPTVNPTLPSIPTGSTSCAGDADCTVGVCGELGLFNLGANVGVCVDATSGQILTASVSASLGNGAQPTVSVPSITVSNPLATTTGATCGPNVPCLVGVCAQIGLLGLGADVGVCVLSGADPLLSVSAGATVLPTQAALPIVTIPNPSATAPNAPATTTAQTCTSSLQCTDPLLGLCVDASVLDIGAGVSICAGASLSPTSIGADAAVTASVTAPIVVVGLPTTTAAVSASVDAVVSVSVPTPVVPAPSTLVTSVVTAPTTTPAYIPCTTAADCPAKAIGVAACVNGLNLIGLDVNICV